MASPRTTAPISSSSSSSSRRQTMRGSPSRFAAATAIPAIPAPTSRPGTHCAPLLVGRTSSTSPIPSCARARTWIISIAPAGASSPYCHAVARRTKSFAGGSKTIRPSGPWCGTALIPRYADGPRDRWFVFRAPLPTGEGWTVVWVWSTLLTLRQEARRKRNMAAASEELSELRERLAGPKTRLRRAADIDFQVKTILEKRHVAHYIKVERTVREDHIYKQARRGRPGPNTSYRKLTKRRFDIEWTIDEEAIAYDHKSDGMYPL